MRTLVVDADVMILPPNIFLFLSLSLPTKSIKMANASLILTSLLHLLLLFAYSILDEGRWVDVPICSFRETASKWRNIGNE